MSEHAPWSFGEARAASEESARSQEGSEQALATANVTYARAEEAYRKALALEMWRLRKDDKVAWTTVGDLARGATNVAELKRVRDDAEGNRSICQHAMFRRGADRRDTERFIDWSLRRDLAEGYGRTLPPNAIPPAGGRG